MRLEKITDRILHFNCDSQKELVLTFCRIQEFYESPHERIRGRRFDFHDFLEAYTGTMGRFTYFTDWGGFNFPSTVLREWYELTPDVSNSEASLLMRITDHFPMKSDERFYVIASCDDNIQTKNHEIAHAMFFLNDQYRHDVGEALGDVPASIQNRMMKVLEKMGYDVSVFEDEINAYLSTSGNKYLHKLFRIKPEECKHANKLKRLFKMYKKTMGIENARNSTSNRGRTRDVQTVTVK